MDRSRIAELAGIISANTAEIDAYIAARGLPSPSFDADSPPELLLCAEVAELRQRILDATDELHALMLGPVGVLTPSVRISLYLEPRQKRNNVGSSSTPSSPAYKEFVVLDWQPVYRLIRND